MAASRFRQAKSADEEAKFVESAVAKSTRCKNKSGLLEYSKNGRGR